jgi:hypothetical protein
MSVPRLAAGAYALNYSIALDEQIAVSTSFGDIAASRESSSGIIVPAYEAFALTLL